MNHFVAEFARIRMASVGALRILANSATWCLLLLALLPAQSVFGQAAWEYSPYRVRVRLAIEPAPQLPAALEESLARLISARASAVLGAVWQVETLAASAKLRDELLIHDDVALDSLVAAAAPDDLAGDKLILAAITRAAGGYEVRVRELDCRARQLGEAFERRAASLEALDPALWDAILESFTPLAKIETVDENRIGCRLRAGGLIVNPASWALIEEGMVLRPVVRRNDRSGLPVKGGIQAVPWTLLSVDQRRDSLLDCTLSTGFRLPIPTRGSARTERLALLVRPRWPTTRLMLRSRSDAAKPLAGYEIHARPPGSENSELLGTTDLDGAIDLPGGGGLQLLYIRSGRQLLARLPVLPGQSETLVASIVDDDRRLQAEGLILALQSRALDLVARRELLAAKFRARLKEGQIAEAAKLLDDFRKLETRQELGRDLEQYRQRVASNDRLTQARIDKLFADAQKLLALKSLSDEMLAQLTRELTNARSGSAPTAGGN